MVRIFSFVDEEVVIANTTLESIITQGDQYKLLTVDPSNNVVLIVNDSGDAGLISANYFDVINKFKKGDIATALIGLGKPFYMTKGKDYEVLDVCTVKVDNKNLQHIVITMDDGITDTVHVDNFYDKSNYVIKQRLDERNGF